MSCCLGRGTLLADEPEEVPGASTLTAAQRRAAIKAAASAKDRRRAADSASAADKAAPVQSQWTRAGGRAIEALLDSVDLVDAKYLLALGEAGGIVPSWQDCPSEARINAETLWQLQLWGFINLPVLVLSYPWLDKAHPSPRLELACVSWPDACAVVTGAPRRRCATPSGRTSARRISKLDSPYAVSVYSNVTPLLV